MSSSFLPFGQQWKCKCQECIWWLLEKNICFYEYVVTLFNSTLWILPMYEFNWDFLTIFIKCHLIWMYLKHLAWIFKVLLGIKYLVGCSTTDLWKKTIQLNIYGNLSTLPRTLSCYNDLCMNFTYWQRIAYWALAENTYRHWSAWSRSIRIRIDDTKFGYGHLIPNIGKHNMYMFRKRWYWYWIEQDYCWGSYKRYWIDIMKKKMCIDST